MPRVEFDKLSTVYDAIKDLDKVLESKSEDKLEDAINCIKNVNRAEFSPEIQDRIINDFKDALFKIYNDTLSELNLDISLKTQVEYIDNKDAGKVVTIVSQETPLKVSDNRN